MSINFYIFANGSNKTTMWSMFENKENYKSLVSKVNMLPYKDTKAVI